MHLDDGATRLGYAFDTLRVPFSLLLFFLIADELTAG